MTTITVKDGEGYDMTLSKHKDIYYPPWAAPENIESVKDFEMRSDDILLLTYPKTGTHWIHEIIQMLLLGKAEPVDGTKEATMIEFPMSSTEHLAQLPPPRILNTHLRLNSIPNQATEKKCRMIISSRNPKDTIVSYYHHTTQLKGYNYEGSFHGYLSLVMEGKGAYGTWFDYYLEAEKFTQENKDLPILTVYYEDMKKDLPKAIREIAHFLDVPCSDDLVAGIAEKATFKNLKQSKDTWANNQTVLTGIFKSGKFPMFRKGMVGDWKNYFTVAENERFDQIYSEKMSDSSLHIRFEL